MTGSPPLRPIEFDALLKDVLSERFRVLVCDEAQWLSRECFELWRHLWDDRRTDHAAALDSAYRQVASRLDGEGSATVDEDGRLHVASLKAVPDPPSLVDLRRRVEAMLPRDRPARTGAGGDVVVPGFTEAFTHTSGNDARVADLGLSVAAVLCANAMNVGFKPVTSPGVEALTRDRLHHVDQNYVRLETLAAANTALVQAQAEIAVGADCGAAGWSPRWTGCGSWCRSARSTPDPNPKYFGRKRGITWLNMINDQAAGLAAKVVPGHHATRCMPRRGAASAGRHGAGGDHHRHRLLLRHRVRAAASAGPSVPAAAGEPARSAAVALSTGTPTTGRSDQAARGRIDTEKIAAHWQDMCRVAVSIHSGEVSAHDVTRMISRDGHPTPSGQAIAHYGRIFKTLHMLRAGRRRNLPARGARRRPTSWRDATTWRRRIFHGKQGRDDRSLLRRAWKTNCPRSGWCSTASCCGTPSTSTARSISYASRTIRCSTPTLNDCPRSSATTSASTATTPSTCPTSAALTGRCATPTAPTTTDSTRHAAFNQPLNVWDDRTRRTAMCRKSLALLFAEMFLHCRYHPPRHHRAARRDQRPRAAAHRPRPRRPPPGDRRPPAVARPRR